MRKKKNVVVAPTPLEIVHDLGLSDWPQASDDDQLRQALTDHHKAVVVTSGTYTADVADTETYVVANDVTIDASAGSVHVVGEGSTISARKDGKVYVKGNNSAVRGYDQSTCIVSAETATFLVLQDQAQATIKADANVATATCFHQAQLWVRAKNQGKISGRDQSIIHVHGKNNTVAGYAQSRILVKSYAHYNNIELQENSHLQIDEHVSNNTITMYGTSTADIDGDQHEIVAQAGVQCTMRGSGKVNASKLSKVTVIGSTGHVSVDAKDDAQIFWQGNGRLHLSGSSKAVISGTGRMFAHDKAFVTVKNCGDMQIRLEDTVACRVVSVKDKAQVGIHAHDQSELHVHAEVETFLHEQAVLKLCSGLGTVQARDASRIQTTSGVNRNQQIVLFGDAVIQKLDHSAEATEVTQPETPETLATAFRPRQNKVAESVNR